MPVQPLGQDDPLEKEIATHSSILVWRIPWTEEPGGLYSPQGRKESDMTEWLSKRTHGQIVVFQVCRKVISGGHNLTELTGHSFRVYNVQTHNIADIVDISFILKFYLNFNQG